ncbi:hypothetical protein [Methylobacterium brachythecii]|uniref:Uncharacterized protein n=1 Tax=Methylobacterium brachythecii TaxID=1176177 RepID=A0A7W6F8N3_9HYPH|nr:hypothetical protein [Methylobacterium brachythecii]MBB3904624.1 hypothetical protein [Methylobacterium brachythecii]GLS45030.1 hypothetical protein GCM10007884_30190 [Methylobacterium brachythecii]
MQTTAEPTSIKANGALQQQVADALRNQALPISKLLRLMWAIEAEASPVSESLRVQLRARIGAPLAN